jgi:hypothetical protein
MKRVFVGLAILGFVAGCGKGDKDPYARWFESPERVVQGIMKAYETRDDSLYAAFLAEDFAYTFEPPSGDAGDVLTWGKSEEVLSASSLFGTGDVQSVRLTLNAGPARSSNGPGGRERMTVPVSGGELVIAVKDKEPTVVKLNRQELVLERQGEGKGRWIVVEWHDFPTPVSPTAASAPGTGAVPASGDSAHDGHHH